MSEMTDAREELLDRFMQVRHFSYEDWALLDEWLSEPMDDDHAQYTVNRSNVQILERLQGGGPLGQINMVRTLRTFVTAQRDYQRLLEEAQTKLAQIRDIVAHHDPLQHERPSPPHRQRRRGDRHTGRRRHPRRGVRPRDNESALYQQFH